MYSQKWKNKTGTRIYYAWRSLRGRCLNPKATAYNHYGGRGITVCDEWKNDYDAFYEWAVVNGYTNNLTLDRIDVNGNYSPENCRWATNIEQGNNTRVNIQVKYGNRSQTITEWCRELGDDIGKTMKRHSAYSATTFEELFCKGSLLKHRNKDRVNLCVCCELTETIKWRKRGKLCNTCYHIARRWAKKNSLPINEAKQIKQVEEFIKDVEQ